MKIKELYYKYEEIISYLIFGGLTTVVSILTYFICADMVFQVKNDLTVQISNVISWICAVIFAYITNSKYVFKSKVVGTKKIKEIFLFFASRLSVLILDMAFMFLFFSVLHINDLVSKIIVQIIVVLANYVLSKIIVFKK